MEAGEAVVMMPTLTIATGVLEFSDTLHVLRLRIERWYHRTLFETNLRAQFLDRVHFDCTVFFSPLIACTDFIL